MGEYNLVHFKDDEFEIDVNTDRETIWLSQDEISKLFEKDRTVITRHINNIFKEGELDRESNVQKMHFTNIPRPVTLYNLDVIISVGYRVKSQRGVKFRKWASEILKQYLTEGYVVNIKKLECENDKLKRYQEMVSIVHRISLEEDISNDEIHNLLSVVKEYEDALDLLDQYDNKSVSIDGKVTSKEVKKIEIDEVYDIINEMKREFDSKLFGKEKDDSLAGSIYNIYQTAFGQEVYPSVEEKASNLLYFLVKNHSFIDGNKRIAASVFMYFMKKNEIYYDENGAKRLSDNTLVALTLLVAESKPTERDLILKIIVNMIGII
jgi:prophage maintenance system killer protein/Zn-finger nucleic acid-binding protein